MAGRYAGEPEDARRGQVVALPTDVDEAKADREMADAERAVALGTASEEQRAAVDRIAHARTHEERRSLWMSN
ncbi:hypothetical protein GCM10023201_54170 [Actinomycetospora corticicola]|jgi:hypothetical protein|uniref:Uncharacterized protein n=1 Tax=Actinomycetospora corticicola TaxID=663602 RepID=A0A7Y9DZT6_9PSEU|nr:hypothetical protein [Actinomycetospora corticicola]NYD38599.1 hypothetical protein [Actinomycetospora corticicola]